MSKRKPITVVITGSKWARGKMRGNRELKPGDSDWELWSPAPANFLLNKDGTQCCLGFEALAYGATMEDIDGVCMPSSIDDMPDDYRQGWQDGDVDYKLCEKFDADCCKESLAAGINDNIDLTDEERIALLRPIFASMDPPRKLVWRPKS